MTEPKLDVLFVGSLPLDSREETFTVITTSLPLESIQRIPDGETGSRHYFIACQSSVFPINALRPRWGGQPSEDQQTLSLQLSDLGPIGYDDWALESFHHFTDWQQTNKIAPSTRFLVCLPTAYTVVQGFLEPRFCTEIEPLYEQKLVQAITRIQTEIPPQHHHRLSIQFDIPVEIAALEYDRGNIADDYWKAWFPEDVKTGILQRLERLIAVVDEDIEVGLHLCYGDLNQRHFVDPLDLGLLVDVMNSLQGLLQQRQGRKRREGGMYFHLPVPKDKWNDDAYFAPLRELKIDGDTKLYFGLIHADDVDGTKARLELARKWYHGPIGISTECGLGRRKRGELDGVLRVAQAMVMG